MAAAGGFDRVDVANQVSDGDVWCCQLLHVAIVRSKPCDGSAIALFGDQHTAALADGIVRIVVDFTSGNVWRLWVKQSGERAKDTALGLPTESEKNKIMA